MPLAQWIATGAFAAVLMSVALYGLAASGHFPAEHRTEALRTPTGAAILWITMVIAIAAAMVALVHAWTSVPWYAGIIAGGGVLLAAPMILQMFPDSFVDGRSGLAALGGLSAALAIATILLG